MLPILRMSYDENVHENNDLTSLFVTHLLLHKFWKFSTKNQKILSLSSFDKVHGRYNLVNILQSQINGFSMKDVILLSLSLFCLFLSFYGIKSWVILSIKYTKWITHYINILVTLLRIITKSIPIDMRFYNNLLRTLIQIYEIYLLILNKFLVLGIPY